MIFNEDLEQNVKRLLKEIEQELIGNKKDNIKNKTDTLNKLTKELDQKLDELDKQLDDKKEDKKEDNDSDESSDESSDDDNINIKKYIFERFHPNNTHRLIFINNIPFNQLDYTDRIYIFYGNPEYLEHEAAEKIAEIIEKTQSNNNDDKKYFKENGRIYANRRRKLNLMEDLSMHYKCSNYYEYVIEEIETKEYSVEYEKILLMKLISITGYEKLGDRIIFSF